MVRKMGSSGCDHQINWWKLQHFRQTLGKLTLWISGLLKL